MAHPKVKIDGTGENFSISGFGSRDGKYRLEPHGDAGSFELLKWDSFRMEYQPLQRSLRKDSLMKKFMQSLENGFHRMVFC